MQNIKEKVLENLISIKLQLKNLIEEDFLTCSTSVICRYLYCKSKYKQVLVCKTSCNKWSKGHNPPATFSFLYLKHSRSNNYSTHGPVLSCSALPVLPALQFHTLYFPTHTC